MILLLMFLLILYWSISVPLPMFILGPSSPDCTHFYDGISTDGGELYEHITCLGTSK